MPASVKLFSNEPILQLTFSGAVDAKLVSDTWLRAAEQAQSADGPLYWLVDVRAASAGVVTSALKEIVMGLAGTAMMPHMNMAIIAQPQAQVDPAWTMPPAGWFTDYDAALNHARAQVVEALDAR